MACAMPCVYRSHGAGGSFRFCAYTGLRLVGQAWRRERPQLPCGSRTQPLAAWVPPPT